MTNNVRIALISGVTSIITALIAAGATVWANEKGRADEHRKEAEIAEKTLTSDLNAAAARTAESSEEAAVGAHEVSHLEPMTATVTSDDRPRTNQAGPVKADICVLTNVGSYGGATKGCTLTREENGWVLVANARKSTSTCQATCFDLRPRPNGPPAP